MSDSDDVPPLWDLTYTYRRKLEHTQGTLRLGGHAPGEPEPVVLESPDDDALPLEGEAWDMYEGEYLERVERDPPPEEVAEQAEAALAVLDDDGADGDSESDQTDSVDEAGESDAPADGSDTDDASGGDESETSGGEAEADEAVGKPDASDLLDGEPERPERPDPGEPEETPIHDIDDLDPEEIPPADADYLDSEYTREDLEDLCHKLGVWDDIEGHGSNDYRRKVDIIDQLEPMLETYHDDGGGDA